MTTGVTNLGDFADTLLAAVVTVFGQDDVDLPARQIITIGQPVADCEQLSVAFMGIITGIPGAGESTLPVTLASPRAAQFDVTIFRQIAVAGGGRGATAALQLIPPAALRDDALKIMQDAYVLHRGMMRARRTGLLRDYSMKVQLGTAVPVQPEGGISGTSMPILVEVS